MDKLGPNLRLLWETCLPWLLGVKVFVERGVVWQAPAFFQVVQVVGALSVVAGIVAGGMTFFVRSLPWSLRRLGMLGALIAVSSLGGFAFSAMPADQYSSRYLAPIIWALPFALAPVCWLLGRKRFAAAFTPYLIAAAVSGWLSFGPFVQGITPVLAPRGAARGEAAVRALLVERGVQYAAADYWFAYRLTFMWNEQVIVVPLEAWQDRYRPYRAAFDTAPTVAYIFHPSQPHANAEDRRRRSPTRRNTLRACRRRRLHGADRVTHDRQLKVADSHPPHEHRARSWRQDRARSPSLDRTTNTPSPRRLWSVVLWSVVRLVNLP